MSGRGKNVELSVQLRHGVLFPGNLVEGVVYINVIGDGVDDYHALRVKVVGKEKVRIRHCKGETGDASSTSAPLLKHLITCNGPAAASVSPAVQDVLPPGKYHYPFAFQLPYDAPASMSKDCRLGEDRISFEYYVKAYVETTKHKRYTVSKSWFTVVKPAPEKQQQRVPPQVRNATFQLSFCGCIPRGVVNVTSTLQRAFVALDQEETIPVVVEVDNSEGKEPVQAAKISLQQHLTYQTHHLRERGNNTVAAHVVRQEVKPGARATMTTAFTVSPSWLPSCCLSHIKVEYTVHVEFSIPLAKDPSLTLPTILVQTIDHRNLMPHHDMQVKKALVKREQEEVAWAPFARALSPAVELPCHLRTSTMNHPAVKNMSFGKTELKMPIPSQSANAVYKPSANSTMQKFVSSGSFTSNPARDWLGGFHVEELPAPSGKTSVVVSASTLSSGNNYSMPSGGSSFPGLPVEDASKKKGTPVPAPLGPNGGVAMSELTVVPLSHENVSSTSSSSSNIHQWLGESTNEQPLLDPAL